MKTKMNIKSIIMVAVICISSLFFINICFAADTGKIIVETAKLREEANTESKVLELASVGDEVEILEETEEWYKVKYKNITGYIRSDLVQVENEENTVTENTSTDTNNTENTETTQNTSVQNTTTENTTTETNTTVETNATETEEAIVEKGKYKITENIKLKIIPLISAIEIKELNKDEEVEVIEILNDWVKVKAENEKEGWVRKDKLVSIKENESEKNNEVQSTENVKPTTTTATNSTNTTKTMYTNSQTVNVREKADKTSNVIKQLSINSKVTVLSTENGWSCVEINGTKGYIAENLLSTTKQETSRSATATRTTAKTNTSTNTSKPVAQNATSTVTPNTATTTASSGTGNSVVAYAKQFLGCRYVYGGTSTSGFDCSGFTQYVYRHFGMSLNRTAAAQYSNGTAVTSLQAGDLVMFGKSGINHVGIYMGGNSFIHAANTSRGVTIDSLSSGYYKSNYVGARRIF